VKIARDSILASLAWMAMFSGSSVLAQQNGSLQQRVALRQAEPIAPGIIESGTVPPPPTEAPTADLSNGGQQLWTPNGAVIDAASEPPRPLCCERCGRGDCCPPLMSITQGVRLLNRTRTRDMVTSLELFPSTAIGPVFVDVLSNRSIDFNGSAGYTLTMERYLGRDRENRDDFLSFSYWGMNMWQDTHGVGANRLSSTTVEFGSLFSPFKPGPNFFDSPVGGFNRADFQSVFYQSEVHNFEIDLRLTPRGRPDRLVAMTNGTWQRQCQPGRYVSYIFGLRYMVINETFQFHSDGNVDTIDPNTGQVTVHPVFGNYGIFSQNNLLGLQFGSDLTFRRCRGDFGVRGRVGPYVNLASQNSHIVSSANGDPYATMELDNHFNANHNQVSLVGELGLFADYRLRPNLIVHAAWDFTWVTGLALAAEQLSWQVTPAPFIVTDGSILYQGVTLQAELTW